ncbi:MAG TPA: SH3 domain-containing protein [Pseudonocardiaceae bacterium]|nr:SH3 domain-containing protein [Pseudonocardiaceae bacterium]
MSKRMLIVVVVLVVVAILFLVQNGKKGNAQPGGASSGSSSSSSSGCQVQVTADVLNVRAAPSTTAKTLTPLHNGQTVSATATTRNGFRELSAGHWASSDFLKPVSGSC